MKKSFLLLIILLFSVISVQADNYNKIEYKAREYDFLAINTNHQILSNVNVRKALSLIYIKHPQENT